MYGNILFGAAIGIVIAHSKGAAYNYPISLSVLMGAMLLLNVVIKNGYMF